ncbi:MAG: DUF3828 domain-containing protein [Muribaculaceae bacterium]|nr:DUF3828 domain-containing protein [Muribaculaceae bacterium]
MNIKCPKCHLKLDITPPAEGGSVECICHRCGNKFTHEFPKPEPEQPAGPEPVKAPEAPAAPPVEQPAPAQAPQQSAPIGEMGADGYRYVYDEPEKKSSRLPLWIALGVVAAAIAVAGIIFLPKMLSQPQDTTIVDPRPEGSETPPAGDDAEQIIKNEIESMWGSNEALSSEFRQLIRQDEALCARTGDIYCIDYDLWTRSQEAVREHEVDQVTDITSSSATAYVRIKYLDNSTATTKLLLVKEGGKWRVDEIVHDGYYEKKQLRQCLKEVSQAPADLEPDSDYTTTLVHVNGVDVRLRTSPKISNSNIIKDGYGKNLHPDKGDELEYLGEHGDFYYVSYMGIRCYISKKHTYLVER